MNKLSMCCKEDLIYLGYGRNTLFSFALGNLYHYCCSKCGVIEWSTQKTNVNINGINIILVN